MVEDDGVRRAEVFHNLPSFFFTRLGCTRGNWDQGQSVSTADLSREAGQVVDHALGKRVLKSRIRTSSGRIAMRVQRENIRRACAWNSIPPCSPR